MKPLFLVLAGLLFAAGPARAEPSLASLRTELERAENAMIADPSTVVDTAIAVERAGQALPAGISRDRLLARAYWLHGEAAGRLRQAPAAQAALVEASRLITRSGKDGALHARIKMSIGATAFDRGDVQAAFANFRDAYAMFTKRGDKQGQALALQSVGLIYIDAGDYERAVRYYTRSAVVNPADREMVMWALSNQALAFKEMGRIAPAEQNYRAALAIARELKNAPDQVKMLARLAAVELEKKDVGAADRIADQAIALGAHDAAKALPLAWAIKARIAWSRGDARATIALAPRVFDGPLDKTKFDFRDAHQALSDAFLSVGNEGAALAHLRAVNRLDSEGREARSAANTALMAAQFDYSNQELRIARRDVSLAQSRARNQWLVLGATLLLLGVALTAFFRIRRSRDAVRAANADLNKTNEALAKALKAKSDFLATTSHEIRTPLNGVLGMAQVLLADKTLPGDVRERVQLLSGAGESMKLLVDDILDVAKMESGTVRLHPSDVDLSHLLTEVCGLWREAAAVKGLSFACDLQDVPERITIDGDRLIQILSNLLSNAIKFTAAGSVRLDVRGHDAQRLTFAVSDTGIGIAVADRDLIFEAFSQVNTSTAREFSGTGLGLSICRTLAAALGGTIAVDDAEGGGSRFTLTVPLETAGSGIASIGHAPVAQRPAENLRDAAVLLIDPNLGSHALMRLLLMPETRSIECAGSRAEARARIDAQRCDHLVIEGAALAAPPDTEAMRALVEAAQAGGALVTILATLDQALPAARALGADQYIVKPIGAADFIAELKAGYVASDASTACAAVSGSFTRKA